MEWTLYDIQVQAGSEPDKDVDNSRKEGITVMSLGMRDPGERMKDTRDFSFLVFLAVLFLVMIVPSILMVWLAVKILLQPFPPDLGMSSPLFPAAMMVGLSSSIGWFLYSLLIGVPLVGHSQKMRERRTTSGEKTLSEEFEETPVGRVLFKTEWTVAFLLSSIVVIYVPLLLAIWFVLQDPRVFIIPLLGLTFGYSPHAIVRFFWERHKLKEESSRQ